MNNKILKALNNSLIIVEFNTKGEIIYANENFLETFHFRLDEIQGKHHSLLFQSKHILSQSCKDFWKKLLNAQEQKGQFHYLDKYGKSIYLQASYNPIKDTNNKVVSIIQFAQDISSQKQLNLYHQAQVEAISKAQAIIEFDIDGFVLDANENFLSSFGYRLDEILGKHHSMFCEKNLIKSKKYAQVWKNLREGKYHASKYKRLGKNGRIVWIQATYNPIKGVNEEVVKIVKFAHDITNDQKVSLFHKAQIEAINKSQAVIEFDINGTILDANENFLKAMGYTLDEIKGKNHSLFCLNDYTSSPEYYEFWKKLQRGKYDSGKYLRIGKNGKQVWIQATYTPILNVDNKPIRILKYAQDITELETIKIDRLTKLYNEGKLVLDIKNNKNNNLAIFDSSEYNAIRDFYGVVAADTLIVQFAEILKKNITKDYLLYRLHNDRFAVLNHNKNKETFKKNMETLRLKTTACTIDAQINQLNLSLTFGLAHGKDDSIINHARTAHNYAKYTNQTLVSYSKKLHIQEQFKEKIFWSKKINLAIQEDRITVHFQPIYNNKTAKIEKHEVLVRAIDQDKSLIYPNKFLDIAKTSHQYLDITRIVILKSFAKFQNIDLEFSINLTAEDIVDNSLKEFLFENIEKYGIGKKLIVEIVESEQIGEYKSIIDFTERLKNYGAKLAIDDFGSGYSNFGYLLEIKADYVKIDGSIVSKILENDYSSEIIRSIVDFCKKMGIKTIAEFVSNEEILKKVIELGVDYSQGFYIGQPQEKITY